MTAATHQDHDLADSKTASRIFFADPPTARLVWPSQVTETHLESVTYVYRNAPGCVVAPNNTAGGNRYDSATDTWVRPDGTSYRTSVNIPDFVVLNDDAPTPVAPTQTTTRSSLPNLPASAHGAAYDTNQYWAQRNNTRMDMSDSLYNQLEALQLYKVVGETGADVAVTFIGGGGKQLVPVVEHGIRVLTPSVKTRAVGGAFLDVVLDWAGVIRDRVPNYRTMVPPQSPPAIVRVIESKPTAAAGAGAPR